MSLCLPTARRRLPQPLLPELSVATMVPVRGSIPRARTGGQFFMPAGSGSPASCGPDRQGQARRSAEAMRGLITEREVTRVTGGWRLVRWEPERCSAEPSK